MDAGDLGTSILCLFASLEIWFLGWISTIKEFNIIRVEIPGSDSKIGFHSIILQFGNASSHSLSCTESFRPSSVGPARSVPHKGRPILVVQGSPIRSADLITHPVGHLGPLSLWTKTHVYRWRNGNTDLVWIFFIISTPNHFQIFIHLYEFITSDFQYPKWGSPSPRHNWLSQQCPLAPYQSPGLGYEAC